MAGFFTKRFGTKPLQGTSMPHVTFSINYFNASTALIQVCKVQKQTLHIKKELFRSFFNIMV